MSSNVPEPHVVDAGVRKFLSKWTILDLGIGLFVASFFLPALDQGGDHVIGLYCALFAFFGPANDNVSGLAVFGALLNPIAITYIVLRIRNRASDARFFLAGAILASSL